MLLYDQMQRVVVDFSKMATHSGTRHFAPGFLTLYGKLHAGNYSAMPLYPGLRHDTGTTYQQAVQTCELVERRPAFVLSNDDIFNLGHYINDVIAIWSMAVLAHRPFRSGVLVNVDGVREGGPAGGPSHRLMVPSAPDSPGPYSAWYYEKWFANVTRGLHYGARRVCFEEVYFFPLPGVPWFWNEWARRDECSLRAASPLYQSFNLLLRQQLLDHHIALPSPSSEEVHIVIEVRTINPAKRNNHASARYIRNLPQVLAQLRTIPNVRVTAQNFAKLDFLAQIRLAHSAHVLISAHGAGTTHIFHMAIGTPRCCALLELFPDQSVDLYTAEGYGNLARMLGLQHTRYVAQLGATSEEGTAFDPQLMKNKVQDLIERVTSKPSCLLEVKDTRSPLPSFT